MKIYLRKIDNQCLTHQISVTKEIVKEMFNDANTIKVTGVKSNYVGEVSILLATDPRFGGDIKNIINQEGGMNENDILVFYKNKKDYSLEVVSSQNEKYYVLLKLFPSDDRHIVLNTCGEQNLSYDDLVKTLKKEYADKKAYAALFFGFKYGTNSIVKSSHKDIIHDAGLYDTYDRELTKGIKLSEIMNSPECVIQSNNDEYDVLNHNVYGIHIKYKNNALDENNEHICIGWSNLGDLTNIKDNKDDLQKLYEEKYPERSKNSAGQDIGQIWRFINEAQIGDYVVFAESNQFSIGKISSDYEYIQPDISLQDQDYVNNRKVEWIRRNIPRDILSKNFHLALATGMSFFRLNDYKSAINDLLCGKYKKDEDYFENDIINVEDIQTNIPINSYFISMDFNNFERNRIVFGAPGTGKSHTLKVDVESFAPDTFERVTFHPDYTYANFVGTYKPVPDKDNPKDITYKYIPGPFMRTLVKALKSINDPNVSENDKKKPYVLVIEEINRANVASVFGEVFQLLDRDSNGVSKYEINTSEDIKNYLVEEFGGQPKDFETIKIPNNMFIWATMNSADQGVFPIDTAFKRRWNFEYIGINNKSSEIENKNITIKGQSIKWNNLRKAINNFLAKNRVNEDKLLGPFFIDENTLNDNNKLIEAFKDKVIMYLFEDAGRQLRNSIFVNDDQNKPLLYSKICDNFDNNGIAIFNKEIQDGAIHGESNQ